MVAESTYSSNVAGESGSPLRSGGAFRDVDGRGVVDGKGVVDGEAEVDAKNVDSLHGNYTTVAMKKLVEAKANFERLKAMGKLRHGEG